MDTPTEEIDQSSPLDRPSQNVARYVVRRLFLPETEGRRLSTVSDASRVGLVHESRPTWPGRGAGERPCEVGAAFAERRPLVRLADPVASRRV